MSKQIGNTMEKTKLEYLPLESLKAYERNTRTHSEEQIEQLKNSITEFGFTNPILIDENNVIIAGHGRSVAARAMGLKEVPCIRLNGLTETQRKALRIADNQLALNAGWDEELLRAELDEIQKNGFDLNIIGFSTEELDAIISGEENNDSGSDTGNYTAKVEAPIYEPKMESAPSLFACYDVSKRNELISEINSKNIPDEVKEFLICAAYRHVKFDYHYIAEYYSHATKEVQELMEKSALVIIDYDKAIELGFVKFTAKMDKIAMVERG